MGGSGLSGPFRERGRPENSFIRVPVGGLRRHTGGRFSSAGRSGKSSELGHLGPQAPIPRGQELESAGAQGHAGQRARQTSST